MRRLVTVLLGALGFLLFLHAVDADAESTAGSPQLSAISHNCVIPQIPFRDSH